MRWRYTKEEENVDDEMELGLWNMVSERLAMQCKNI
jgi:hypothetical protein